jgi:hypothetical protein
MCWLGRVSITNIYSFNVSGEDICPFQAITVRVANSTLHQWSPMS